MANSIEYTIPLGAEKFIVWREWGFAANSLTPAWSTQRLRKRQKRKFPSTKHVRNTICWKLKVKIYKEPPPMTNNRRDSMVAELVPIAPPA